MYTLDYLKMLYDSSFKSPRPWAKPPAQFKKRAWAFEVYDDNKGNVTIGLSPTPEDWHKVLADWKVHAYVIKHDKDKNPDGTDKKPHSHVMVMFDGPTSATVADQVRDAVGGVGLEPINSIKSYARYLCHLDNADKEKYNPDEVITFGVQDYMDTIESAYNRYKCIDEMTRYVDTNNVRSFYSLMRFARDYNSEWYRCLLDNVSVLKEYIKGRQYEWQKDYLEDLHEQFKKIDE